MKTIRLNSVLVGGMTCLALSLPVMAIAQNVAVVNGKGVPVSRVDIIKEQVKRSGQPLTPELENRIKDEVVLREIFMQEATARGVLTSPEYIQQMEMARENFAIRQLFEQYKDKNPVTDKEIQAEYDKAKAEVAGKSEYRARHILVSSEAQAGKLIAQIKKGGKFDDLAKKFSSDSGSAKNGGDLSWAEAESYVPEFSEALKALKKGQVTDTPVKTQFGWHIIKLEDTRPLSIPPLSDEIKQQISQQLEEQKMANYRDELRKNARTDYKFSQSALEPQK